MRTLRSFIQWASVFCLIVLPLFYFQCPTPAGPTPTPTGTSPARPPTATHTPTAAAGAIPRTGNLLPPYSGDYLATFTNLCPGTTYGVQVRVPPDWSAWPWTTQEHGWRFSMRNPSGHSGIDWTVWPASGAGRNPDGFPWQGREVYDQLYHGGIPTNTLGLGNVTILGNTWPAYSWQGPYLPLPLPESSSAPASHGRYQLQGTEGEFTGLITIIPYGQEYLEIVAFAPTGEWEERAADFSAILASMAEPAPDWTIGGGGGGGAADPTAGWSSLVSTSTGGPGYAMRYPPDWDAEPLPGGGFQVSSADTQTAVTIRTMSGDPAALLASWQAPLLTAPTIEEGVPVIVAGAERPSRIAYGQSTAGSDVTSGVAFGQIGTNVVEVLWYAPSGEAWDNYQETFANVLASILVLRTETSDQYDLMVSYPADWNSAPAPGGEGLWMSDAGSLTGWIIWIRESGNPAEMLAGWSGVSLSAIGGLTPSTVTGSASTYLLEESRPRRDWQGQDTAGTALRGSVVMAAHGDTVLEIVWYAQADQWDTASRTIFSNLHSLIRTLQ